MDAFFPNAKHRCIILRSTSRAQMSETVTGDASSNQFILQGPPFRLAQKSAVAICCDQICGEGTSNSEQRAGVNSFLLFVAPRHPGLFAMTRWGYFYRQCVASRLMHDDAEDQLETTTRSVRQTCREIQSYSKGCESWGTKTNPSVRVR